VLVVAESVFDGTWGSGEIPEDLRDYLLCRHMRWTWAELEATPAYVRRVTWDLMQAEIRAQDDEMESARRQQQAAQQQGGRRA
jgi:hypothetical protein